MLSFVGKHLSFYPKDFCSFSLLFYLSEGEINQQVCLTKYVEHEFLKQFISKNIISKSPELLIIINYHFNHLWSDPGENLKKRNWC